MSNDYLYNLDLNNFEKYRKQVNSFVIEDTESPSQGFVTQQVRAWQGDGLAEDGVNIKHSSMRHCWWSVRGIVMALRQSVQK